MHAPESSTSDLRFDREDLARQVRLLQERLAFYEGFDHLIQDNVAQARELFRRAAQEREAATSATGAMLREADRREEALRAELAVVAAELHELAGAVEALSRRVASALPTPGNGAVAPAVAPSEQPVAVVIHGVSSAKTALSLQRFVASLPQVAEVSAREFAGGVLRLDARVQETLQIEAFHGWEEATGMQLLTAQPDVLEFSLDGEDAVVALRS